MSASADGRVVVRSVLEEEREFFLRSLRDLEAERAAGDIDDVDYESLRDDYTVRAAEVLRQLAAIDVGVGPHPAPVEPPADLPAPDAAVAAPAAVDTDSAAPHAAAADGDSAAPNAAAADGDSAAAADASLAGVGGAPARPLAPLTPARPLAPLTPARPLAPLTPARPPAPLTPARPLVPLTPAGADVRAASPWRRRLLLAAAVLIVIGGIAVAVIGLSGSPRDSATRVRQLDVAAQDAIGAGHPEKAVADYEAALKIEPTDVVTLTGEGELLVEVGADRNQATLELGLTRLRSAEIADPSYGPAFGARGIGFLDEKDYAAAIPELESYLADTPPAKRSPAIQQALVLAQNRLAADKT